MKVKITTLTKNIEKLIFSKFKIEKQPWNDNYIYIPYLYNTKEDDAKIEDIDYHKFFEVREYIDILEDNLTPKEKRIMYNKLKTLTIEKNKKILLAGSFGRYYFKNKIEYSFKNAIGHELLHMSSSYGCNKFFLSGFAEQVKSNVIGDGLNEGYTELLATRFFKTNGKPDSYNYLVNLAYLLEQFFENKEDMRKLYFNHDLLGFIQYMEQFTERKNVLKFIKQMDQLLSIKSWFPVWDTIVYYQLQAQLNEWFKKKITDEKRRKQFDNCRLRGIFYSKIDDDNIKKLTR